MSIDSYSRCFLLVVHHRGSRRGGRGARARRPGVNTILVLPAQKLMHKIIGTYWQYWDRTDKIEMNRHYSYRLCISPLRADAAPLLSLLHLDDLGHRVERDPGRGWRGGWTGRGGRCAALSSGYLGNGFWWIL